MKTHWQRAIATAVWILSSAFLQAYERSQGPTEVLFWNKTGAYPGYTLFGARTNAYLINLEGRVVHTWPAGTNPRLLSNGNLLDAIGGDLAGFSGLQELDWEGNRVWQHTETRAGYVPHHDFVRIFNAKLGAPTTLYIAARSFDADTCVAAGCNPANGPYTNAQVDAVVEVDMTGNVVWEWCFMDHGIQDFDATKANYVGAGRSISNYPGRLNLNLPGRPVAKDWLQCNSIDHNAALDQIVINAAGGEFYVIDHGNTFVAGNPAASIALAAGAAGDFLYRFGDPARYGQGNPPSIQQNWATSTTGNKQIGGSSHAQWIAAGLPGAGHFLVFNNGGDLFETTPQSYIFEVNGCLNASTNDTGTYVNPPAAGYNNWAAPGHDTDKRTKAMSRQITWMYYSMANQGLFSHLDSGAQRLPNGNTLVCASAEGHLLEVTAAGEAVWEYVNPVSADGIIAYKRDAEPMHNAVFRAYRYAADHPAFAGRALVPGDTITGRAPFYISAPTLLAVNLTPVAPSDASAPWVTALITNSRGVASATLTVIARNTTNAIALVDDGAHQDGASGDGVFGAQIPAFPAGTQVSYFLAAQDEFGLTAASPAGAPANRHSYVVQAVGLNTPPVLAPVADRTVNPGYTLLVTNLATDTDLPPQTLTFSLLEAPANASLDAGTGVVTFTPSLIQLGTTNRIIVAVTDNGTPALKATNSFLVIVSGNTAPVLAPVANRSVEPGSPLVVALSAADAEVPTQSLTYELVEAPPGAAIHPTSGVINWLPTQADNGTTHEFLVVVSDNGTPSLIDWQTFTVAVAGNSEPVTYDLLLGRPTDTSVTVSVLASRDLQAYFEYGAQPGVYTGSTPATAVSNALPSHLAISSLAPNQRYYYRLRYSATGGAPFSAGPERTFVTQRARGSTFTFDIEADPHHRDNEPAVWRTALTNILADQPDFLIDLGDVFMEEKLSRTNAYYLTRPGIFELHREVRAGFLSIVGHSTPTFLVNGNHEAELGWLLTGVDSPGAWGAQARQSIFPVPVPGGFFSGASATDPYTLGPRDGYYAFEWGDALFVTLDPFWFTRSKPGLDGWGWTLGADQYAWLQRTLEGSTATFKFVFVHHLVGGGDGGEARGGLEKAPLFEWGGYDTNGLWGFAANRPGWAMPIQSLLLSNGVQAVFHGHDHLFVKQSLDANGDGTTDLVYQEVPQPSRTNYNAVGAAAGYGYTNGVILGNSGHLRVTVSPTNATVDYVRAFLPADESSGRTNRMVSHSYTITPATAASVPFSGNVILGRPTANSITASVLSQGQLSGYIEYGLQPGVYGSATPLVPFPGGRPVEVVLNQLQPDTRYYYRVRSRSAGQQVFQADVERSFHTQRAAGGSFTFEVQGDSHPERSQQFDAALYTDTLMLAAADQPDFYVCMGDDFSVDTIPTNLISSELVAGRYALQRPYLGLVANSAALFLVNGNHEQAARYLLDGTSNNVAVWAGNARNTYYPQPAPDGFYTGDAETVPFVGLLHDYYAWTWGDALFVTIDPYWHCDLPVDNVYGGAAKRTNWWDVTHGEAQYQWLKTTLEQSTAKYKFVFAHHVLGSGRGGAEEAGLYEWGGFNANGTWGFDANRAGWALPIHQLMATNRVTAFIQGHDHIFVHQERDGVAYLTMPEPADPNYALDNADAYASIYETNNTGRVRFNVTPDRVVVEYVRSYLPADEGPGRTNNAVDYRLYLYPNDTRPAISNAWSMARLPDTGQAQSYTATPGEDSDYTINPPSFTDNGDGTVLDNVTGLVWQKADGGEMTWSNAVFYAQTNRVGGRSDWRLPTSHEAFSILNHGAVNPALDTNVFTLSSAKYWWTADAQVGDATRIWSVNAGGGIGAHRQDETVSAGGTNRYHVRCVRGAPLLGRPQHHFTNNLDGTITDIDTGLTWQQAESSAMNWQAALQFAESLSLAGKTDWRLPNIKELQSINEESRANPSLDTNVFAGASTSSHWSSTTLMNLTNRAWTVNFQLGLVSYDDKQTNLLVRCVRGGAAGLPPSTNAFTPRFVSIPAGTYEMGDHFGFVDPAHPSDEVPVHGVRVDAFHMESTLLTCLEYVEFLNAALAQGLIEVRTNFVYGAGGTNIYCDTYGSDTNSRVQWTGSAFTVRDNRELHPITGVRWFGAIAYCNWASARDGLVPCYNLATGDCALGNSGYRLPTEAEWEYAARGGLYNPYGMFPWGSDTNAAGTLANWAGKTHPFATGPYPWTTPVGFYDGSLQYKTNFNWPGAEATYQTRNGVNGFGLSDMSGNVWEWVNDWYANDYYATCLAQGVVTNPPGPLTGSLMPDGKPYRGLRGGNWFNGQDQYGHARVSNRDPSYFRGPGDPNGPWFHVGFRVMRRAGGSAATNQPPTIASVTLAPATPTSADAVWVTARMSDDQGVVDGTLTYSTGGSGGAAQTNTVFLETMAGVSSKPWTGGGCSNAWTVTGTACEQRGGANYGTGNTNGMEFKGGTTNLTDNMIATTGSIDARGSSGFVEFWVQTLTLSNQFGNAGWTFQLDSGTGYVTRLSELTSTNHTWRLYHYDLLSSERVGSVKMRFQFRGGSAESRIDLDQISVKVATAGGTISNVVAMLDDGAHNDGAAGDGTFGAQIPALPVGTTVSYHLRAVDAGGLSAAQPPGAPTSSFSYTVQEAGSNTPPSIANPTISPSSAAATNVVWITAQVTDNASVAQVTLTYNAGAGATNVAMLDDGAHNDGAAGDHVYGAQIPALPAGTVVSYYLGAVDAGGLSASQPPGAPTSSFSYTVRGTSGGQTVGLFLNTTNAFPGYTLMAPMHHTNTYLINNAGEIVHMWRSAYEPGRSAYLMPNGHMFRAGMVRQGGPSTGGGEGGRVEEFDWDGNLVWAIDYYSPTYIHHHDFKVLPNGNVLLLVAEKKTYAEVLAAGFNPALLDPSVASQGYMLPDCLVEVTPTRPYGGTVVWEWHLWDHMIQDFDPARNNYGVVANHPELIDVNGTGQKIPQFWNHVNGIDYNPQLDQVMLSIRGNSELFIIDHQATTAQSAGHTGGRYGKGGDILYRWGNPQQYNRGNSASQQLYQQHHTHWIETNCPGAGNILIFNNGIGRGYSTINEIIPPVDPAGSYSITAGTAFGPASPAWTYTANPQGSFYSAEISGAERLPNGNTLICEGIKGNLFEVTSAGQIVWRYICPVTGTLMTQGDSIPVDPARTDQFMNAVFRVNRYGTDYAGLAGRDLTPQGPIELPADTSLRLLSCEATAAGVQFNWSSLPSRNYAVLYKASLNAPAWTSIATNQSVGTVTTFRDRDATRLGRPSGFYRVTALP